MKAWLLLAAEVRRDLASLPRIDTPSVRSVRRRYSKVLADESPRIVLRFVMSLRADAGWAQRVVSWEVFAAHERAFGLLNDRLVEEMAHGLADWGSVDLFGVTVVGPAWRAGLMTDSKILAWARSHDRWRRRLALVATVPLNSRARGGTGDARKTLRICRVLVGDSDDMVVKAMSWSLRELANQDPKVVEDPGCRVICAAPCHPDFRPISHCQWDVRRFSRAGSTEYHRHIGLVG